MISKPSQKLCLLAAYTVLFSSLSAAPPPPVESDPNQNPLLDPPPISLSLHNASYDDLGKALATATGADISLTKPTPPVIQGPRAPGAAQVPDFTFNLDSGRRPLWSIFQDLCAQHALTFEQQGPHRSQLRLANDLRAPLKSLSIWKGFASFLTNIERSSVADPQLPENAQNPSDNLNIELETMADPRVPVLRSRRITLLSATDNLGNDLLAGGTVKNPYLSYEGENPSGTIQIPFPKTHGHFISLLKGESHIQIATAYATLNVLNLQQSLQKTLHVGPQTVTFKDFSLGPDGLLMAFDFPPAGDKNADPASRPPAVELDIMDADGHHFALYLHSFLHQQFIPGAMKPPLNATFKVPSRILDVEVPFEFHNIPIPD